MRRSRGATAVILFLLHLKSETVFVFVVGVLFYCAFITLSRRVPPPSFLLLPDHARRPCAHRRHRRENRHDALLLLLNEEDHPHFSDDPTRTNIERIGGNSKAHDHHRDEAKDRQHRDSSRRASSSSSSRAAAAGGGFLRHLLFAVLCGIRWSRWCAMTTTCSRRTIPQRGSFFSFRTFVFQNPKDFLHTKALLLLLCLLL